MRRDIKDVGPSFREMAHGIGIAVAATCDAAGHPHTRPMQPVWVGDGSTLTGWASTATDALKAGDLAGNPRISFTYCTVNPEKIGRASCRKNSLSYGTFSVVA